MTSTKRALLLTWLTTPTSIRPQHSRLWSSPSCTCLVLLPWPLLKEKQIPGNGWAFRQDSVLSQLMYLLLQHIIWHCSPDWVRKHYFLGRCHASQKEGVFMSPATIIVGIVILIAVIYMVRHVRGMFNGSSGCSCCDGGGSCCSTRKSKSDSTKK